MKNIERMEELKDALDEARASGEAKAEAEALYGIGLIYFKEKVYEAARDFWGQCEVVCAGAGLKEELLQVSLDLGAAAMNEDDLGESEKFLSNALAIANDRQDPKAKAKVLDKVAALAVKSDRPEAAYQALKQAQAICEEHEDRIGSLYFLEQMIPVLRKNKAGTVLLEIYRQAITLAEKIGDKERMALGLIGLAELTEQENTPKDAIPYLVMAHDIYLFLGKEKEAGLVRVDLTRLGWTPEAE